ncbi:sigma-70 family RNA polymerase sigma factor [Oceanobacillus sojae]|uniref:RNA polymerase sigma factor n=1 Tax=Oceanobacillus sojae TaxID=582851 RepID=UPI002882E82D|nr:sigma-70 family RNA polymerase sigma factor [Oceanobacillus sojae]
MTKEEEELMLSLLLRKWKELKIMKLTSYEEHKKHTFDSYCKKTLKNEVINIQRQLQRQREVEVSFTNLSNFEPQELAVIDDYVLEGYYFQVLGYEVNLKNEKLIRALCHLSDKKREVILLSYFLNMTDKEVGEVLGFPRSTVQYQRKKALEELKQRLGGNDDGSESIDFS